MRCLVRRSLLAMLVLAAAPTALTLAAPDATLSRIVGDVTVHVGVAPLAVAMEREASTPSEVTHGQRGTRKSTQHVVVALFDTRSGQRIGDAQVSAVVSEVGFGSQEKPLARMTTRDAVSYGNTFDIKPGGRYTIKVVVRRPGAHVPTETTFDYLRP
jgi:hypothetical protein